jgi:glutamyl-tRNA synthetase
VTSTVPSPPPRVRFCPAPSGWLHVGSVRAALYNWLHARHHGGTFVFRIEDTDATRATEESMRSMMEALEWVGLRWDEGPEVRADGALVDRGAHGPYRQSERGALYTAVARRLEAAGATYRDHRTAEELEAWRERHRSGSGEGPPVVKAATFEHTPDELSAHVAGGRPGSLRLRTPESGEVVVTDLIRGEVRWEWAQISDPVIERSDGTATYPLANSVDDLAQGIDVICRGEDLLSVTPRQVLLHDLLTRDGLLDDALAEVGFPAREAGWTRPRAFAHLPMVVGMDRKKLSKRHDSVSTQEFRRQGFLPETLRNYLALLGWASRDGRERLTDDELVAAFDLADVGRAAAAFDVDKLTAFNGERIRDLPPDELASRLLPYLDGTEGEALVDAPPTERQQTVVRGLVPLVQERMQRLDEVQRYAPAFLREQVELDPDSVAKVLAKPGAAEAVAGARQVLTEVPWELAAIEAALRQLAEQLGTGFGKVAQPIRVAVTGSTVSPPLFESIELLGREVTVARLDAALPAAGTVSPDAT